MSELYELPNGWEWKKLEYVCDKSSSNISKNQLENEEGNYPIYGASGLLKNVSFYHMNKPYIGIIKDGAGVGRVMLLNEYSSVIGTLQYLIPKNNVEIKYLFYQLTMINFQQYVSGATIPHIYYKNYKEHLISLPPLSEQQRIVSKLDLLFAKIDKSIELHQKNIDEANAFMGSVLNEVFGELEEKYVSKSIETFSKVGTGVTPLKNKLEYYNNGNINWITSRATNNEFVYEAEQLITKTALDECRLKMNPIGTLIVALYGQGKTRGQVSELRIESATNQAIATIIVDDKQSINIFLKYFLKKSYLDLRDMANGGTQPNLNLSIIKVIKVPLPPPVIQEKVVEYLDSVSEKMEKVKSIQKEKMKSLKALKASILDRAFRGEL